MDAPARLSFVSYAVNGSGLGHLVRQIAIQRWLRRYATFCGTRTAHWFLTTSEADTLLHAEGFAGLKLPSKSVVEESGIGKLGYVTLAKQWVWNSLASIRPDVLLVDTFPNGSFHELVAALDMVQKKALVLRPVKEDFARRSAYAAMVGLYDKVIVPAAADEESGLADAMQVPASRLAYSGPLFRLERFELRPRTEARESLGVRGDVPVLLVSGGGGGDPSVERLFDELEEAVTGRTGLHLVYAAGPLFRGRPRRGPQCTWFTGHDLAEHLAGVDVAICAAGFNSFHELAFAGVPTVFVPQDKVADDQRARATLLAQQGAARVAFLGDGTLGEAVRALLDDAQQRMAVAAAARRACPENHARSAALEVLSLVMPKSLLRQARAVVDDELLGLCATRGVPLGAVVDVAVALAPDADRAALELEEAVELVVGTRAPAEVLARTAAQLHKKVRSEGLSDALARLVNHAAIDGQWSALGMLLQALCAERVLSPAALVEEVLTLVEQAAAAGLDVFAAARLLEQARPLDEDGRSTNRGALDVARARVRTGVAP